MKKPIAETKRLTGTLGVQPTRNWSSVAQIMIQINPPMPLETPKGKALAHFLIDYGPEHHLMWVCFQDKTGECWTWSNEKIRAQNNPTLGRVVKFADSPPEEL